MLCSVWNQRKTGTASTKCCSPVKAKEKSFSSWLSLKEQQCVYNISHIYRAMSFCSALTCSDPLQTNPWWIKIQVSTNSMHQNIHFFINLLTILTGITQATFTPFCNSTINRSFIQNSCHCTCCAGSHQIQQILESPFCQSNRYKHWRKINKVWKMFDMIGKMSSAVLRGEIYSRSNIGETLLRKKCLVKQRRQFSWRLGAAKASWQVEKQRRGLFSVSVCK